MPFAEAFAANATAAIPPQLDPLVEFIRSFFGILSALLGGLFGLYFIFIIIRLVYDRKVLREIREMKRELAAMREQLGQLTRRRR